MEKRIIPLLKRRRVKKLLAQRAEESIKINTCTIERLELNSKL